MPQESSLVRVLVVTVVVSSLVGALAGRSAAVYGPDLVKQLRSNGQATSTTRVVPFSISQDDQQVIDIVKKASPAVVSINISKTVSTQAPRASSPFDQFFADPFGNDPFMSLPLQPRSAPKSDSQQPSTQTLRVGGGSGFFVSSDGMLVTNRHVVDDDKAEYTVVTTDGQTYPAKVLAIDPVLDLAVLKVDGKDFPYLDLETEQQPIVGQTVIAIGYALGEFENTVTKGVISGLNRHLVAGGDAGGSEVIEAAIQTDAAINPGNSGGPLISLNGHVIGINTAISEGAQSLGFALPSQLIAKVVDSVKKNGRIVRPWIGIRYLEIDQDLAKKNQLNYTHGALIQRGDNASDLAVIPGSPGDKAGLKENDILLKVNDDTISSTSTLTTLLQKYGPGDTITLKIARQGKEQDIKVTLEERKQSDR